MEHRKKIARNAAGFLLAGLSGHAYVLATVPILTRWLSDAEWGFFTILIQVNVILQYASLTLFTQSLLKFYVEYADAERRRFIGTAATTIVILQGMLVAGLYLGRNWLLPELYPNLTLPIDPAIGLAAGWFFAAPLRMFGYSILKIQERVRPVLVLNLVYGVSLCATVFYFLIIAEGGFLGAILAMVTAEWMSLLIVAWVVRHELAITVVGRYLVRCVGFAAPLAAGTVCVLVLNNLDRWVLSRHIDLAGMGVYGVGAIIGNTLGLFVTAAMTAISPRMVKVIWEEGRAAAASLSASVVPDVVVLVGMPFAFLSMFGDVLVLLLGGSAPKWAGAGYVVVGIAAGHFVRSIFLVSQNVLFYRGRTGLHFMTNLMLVGVALVVGPLLAATDAMRVSWMLAVTYAVLAPLTFLIARRYLAFSPRLTELALPLAGIGVAICVVFISRSLDLSVNDPSWWISRFAASAIVIGCCASQLRRLYGVQNDASSVSAERGGGG